MTMEKLKKNLPIIFLIGGGVFILAGILAWILLGNLTEGLVKVLGIISAIVMIVIGGLALYYAFFLSGGEKQNFFLFDSKTKTNIPIEELEFEQVNRKMTYFLTKISSNASELWKEDIVGSDNENFGEDDLFRPLVAYKMIFDLVDRNAEGLWKLYLNADEVVIISLTDAISVSGDNELARTIRYLHKNANGNYETTAKFLNDNKNYIQKKMMKYVKANIEKF